jgi:hypothetical protein
VREYYVPKDQPAKRCEPKPELLATVHAMANGPMARELDPMEKKFLKEERGVRSRKKVVPRKDRD